MRHEVWRQALFEVIHQVKERHPGIFNSLPFYCTSYNSTIVGNICVLWPHSCALLTYSRRHWSTLGIRVWGQVFVHGRQPIIISRETT